MLDSIRGSRGLVACAAFAILITWAHAPVSACTGDCSAEGDVTVDEIVLMVSIALGGSATAACERGDANADGSVTVDEIVVAISNALNGCGDCSVDAGLDAFRNGDLRAADAAFACAVAKNPRDDRANVLRGLSRIAVHTLDDPTLRTLMRRGGITVDGDSRSLCEVEAATPEEVPDGAPRGNEIVDTIRSSVVAEVRRGIDNLSRAGPSTSFRLDAGMLPDCLRAELDDSEIEVEVDLADVLAVRAGLELMVGSLEALAAYDLDVDLGRVAGETPRSLLERDARLGVLRAGARLEDARVAFQNGFAAAADSVTAILAEADDQGDDVLVVDSDERDVAAELVRVVSSVRDAFDGSVEVPVDVVAGVVVPSGRGETVDLRVPFSGAWGSLRTLLPAFSEGGGFDLERFPDPTFVGALPGFTQEKIDRFGEGVPACTACGGDLDCGAFGLGETRCFSCFDECTGEPNRCAFTDFFIRCGDGLF